jgi:hypothetical protein
MAERLYSGESLNQVTVREGSDRRPLDLRRDLSNHSANGFAGIEGGADAAQLALALLADALGNDTRALRLQEDFTRRVVTNFPARWTISRSRIIAHVDMIEIERDKLLNSLWPASTVQPPNALEAD